MPGNPAKEKKTTTLEERIARNHANNAAQRFTLAGRQARGGKLAEAEATAAQALADLEAAKKAVPENKGD